MGEPSIIRGLLYIGVGIHNSRGFIDGRTIYNPYVHCASIHNFRVIINGRTISSIIHGLLYIGVGIHNSRGFIDGRTIYNPYVHGASIHNFRAIIDGRTIYNSQIIIHRRGQALSIIRGILWMGSRLHL